MLSLFLAACATALATGLGALPAYALHERTERLQPALWGTVAGVMTVASIQGLLLPGLREGADAPVIGGAIAGVAFLLVARTLLDHRQVHIGTADARASRRAALVFAVLLVHSLPEGLALGAAWASGTTGLGVFVFVAIAIQNIPEGTATAIPLRAAGVGLGAAVAAAVATSAPQPIGALAAYVAVDAATGLLGAAFGFAAGAMLALVVVEIVPTAARRGGRGLALAGALAGAATMVALGLLLGID